MLFAKKFFLYFSSIRFYRKLVIDKVIKIIKNHKNHGFMAFLRKVNRRKNFHDTMKWVIEMTTDHVSWASYRVFIEKLNAKNSGPIGREYVNKIDFEKNE